jgi:hypothetical protein
MLVHAIFQYKQSGTSFLVPYPSDFRKGRRSAESGLVFESGDPSEAGTIICALLECLTEIIPTTDRSYQRHLREFHHPSLHRQNNNIFRGSHYPPSAGKKHKLEKYQDSGTVN